MYSIISFDMSNLFSGIRHVVGRCDILASPWPRTEAPLVPWEGLKIQTLLFHLFSHWPSPPNIPMYSHSN